MMSTSRSANLFVFFSVFRLVIALCIMVHRINCYEQIDTRLMENYRALLEDFIVLQVT